MPSTNTSSKETRILAKRFIKAGNSTEKDYRKLLSKLRAYIDVLERKACANKWADIKYENVPSQANLKYRNAFLKHDKDRREEYLSSLVKGETKINASTLFPHDIVYKYHPDDYPHSISVKDTTLEELWKSLPNYVNGNMNTLVVRDGSGSMITSVGNTLVTALDVATALSIYFSERCEGVFKDKFITFSSKPEFVDLSKLTNLHDKIEECYRFHDCSNTDIGKTFDLLLDIAVENNLKQEEIPNLLIISDMEFDNATCSVYKEKIFEIISAKFSRYGYQLPKLIFWNVNSRTTTIPLTQNKHGVILVSGFSPVITKMVLSEETDPYKALVQEITSDRYRQVTLKTV